MADQVADYVVVGGGLTGCVVASRLRQSANKPEVVLLEAGPETTNPAASGFISGLSLLGSDLDYTYQSQPVQSTHNRLHMLNAGKCLGGGSILNYGGWLPADAADYDEWADTVKDPRWSYEGLEPWLRKAEEMMHVVTIGAAEEGQRKYRLRDAVKEAWTELGVTHNVSREYGTIGGLTEMRENSHDGMRQPSQTVYSLDGVKVLTDATVNRIIFSGSTACGVEWNDDRKILARKEVIICAGAYRTPQLLMLSGIGPSAELTQRGIPIVYDSQYVGQNLHDHFAVYFAFRLRDADQGYALGNAAWGQNPALNKGLPWDWVVSQPLPPEILAKQDGPVNERKKGRNLYEIITVYVPPGIPGILVNGTHIATSTMLLLPSSRGTVSLASGAANVKESPHIRPGYFSTQLDRDTLIHAARQTLKAMLTTASMGSIVESETPPSGPGVDNLEPLTAESSDEAIEDRIRRTGTQHHHSGGTAAMGKVVDTEGRVLGVKGLRVADASIVPIPLGGHPQATLYALAEQLAIMIVKE
ncbi:hypothetical protein N0V82_005370 [Gnomoniopsis sp. IMI 355080]|nr:hypothetical protein N0V82_005370 [Gnomoniopsis sp. IMI 355080]